MSARPTFKPVFAILLAAAVTITAMFAPTLIHVPPGNFIPPSFVTHSFMLALSVALMWWLSTGRLGLFGFTKGSFEFTPRILLWVLPTAALSLVSAFASPGGQGTGGPFGFTKAQSIVFVWIYASICEEVVSRGLLQTLLSNYAPAAVTTSRRLSMPVLVSGLFFGCMHFVLFKSMGPAAAPIILLATALGLVAARYRERTGSLLPSIIIHALFNVGGMLPLWVVQWIRG